MRGQLNLMIGPAVLAALTPAVGILGAYGTIALLVFQPGCGGSPANYLTAQTAEQVLRMVTFVADPLQDTVVATCKAQEAKLDEWQTANAEEDAQQDQQIAELRARCDRVLEAFTELRRAQLVAVQLLELHQQGQKSVAEVAEAIGAVDTALEAARRAMLALGLKPPGGGRGS